MALPSKWVIRVLGAIALLGSIGQLFWAVLTYGMAGGSPPSWLGLSMVLQFFLLLSSYLVFLFRPNPNLGSMALGLSLFSYVYLPASCVGLLWPPYNLDVIEWSSSVVVLFILPLGLLLVSFKVFLVSVKGMKRL